MIGWHYMVINENKVYFYRAWARLIFTYLAAFFLSFSGGVFLTQIVGLAPETLFALSTKRISYVLPVFQVGTGIGLDLGILLFAWNSLVSLFTVSFLYTSSFFNPLNVGLFPQAIRKALCGKNRMKLLCFLPGCMRIEEESLRRLYVWLMVPWLGMLLLGFESGLIVSTSTYAFGSYGVGFISLLPHGIVEIPTIAFAGAVTFAAHLKIKEKATEHTVDEIFEVVDAFKNEVPLKKIILLVLFCLFVAGLIEAHITTKILDMLLG
ncbi:MAG: stage II sporulation protein M [Desulfocapsa sp.]|nr:stage II sporulation protein M [Desulfocapsa sp.]